MCSINRYLSVLPERFENQSHLPNSRAQIAQEINTSGLIVDCWKMDGNDGGWTTIFSARETVSAGEKICFAFWAKFVHMGCSFWLELAVNNWDKRTIWKLDQNTSQLVAKDGDYYLFVTEYEAHEDGNFIAAISVSDFEASIFTADESEVIKYKQRISGESNVIDFHIPFSGFENLNFINCFTSAYLFMNNISGNHIEFPCEHSKKSFCNICGTCKRRLASVHEKYYFIFDTLSGRSALRRRFNGVTTEMASWLGATHDDGCGSDNMVEFLFGLTGYNYYQIRDRNTFQNSIVSSIKGGIPVLAKVKGDSGRFRVITGYRGNIYICPNHAYAQNAPYEVIFLNELDCLYIIGERTTPKYTFSHGLERIIKVMSSNINNNLWHEYCEKIGLYTKDSFGNVDINEKKMRMKTIADTMWYTFNCHNFAEVFRLRHYLPFGNKSNKDSIINGMVGMEKLSDEKFEDLISLIGHSNGYTHDLAWALIRLEAVADWSAVGAHYLGEMVELTLMRIAENDKETFDAVKNILDAM